MEYFEPTHEQLDSLLQDFLPKVPGGLHEALQRLLSKEPRQRPTSQLLALIKYFADPAVHTLQFLDVISMKDPSQKANFYRHQLKDVLPYIPKVRIDFLTFYAYSGEFILTRQQLC